MEALSKISTYFVAWRDHEQSFSNVKGWYPEFQGLKDYTEVLSVDIIVCCRV
jgi:hypothetical protein